MTIDGSFAASPTMFACAGFTFTWMLVKGPNVIVLAGAAPGDAFAGGAGGSSGTSSGMRLLVRSRASWLSALARGAARKEQDALATIRSAANPRARLDTLRSRLFM